MEQFMGRNIPTIKDINPITDARYTVDEIKDIKQKIKREAEMDALIDNHLQDASYYVAIAGAFTFGPRASDKKKADELVQSYAQLIEKELDDPDSDLRMYIGDPNTSRGLEVEYEYDDRGRRKKKPLSVKAKPVEVFRYKTDSGATGYGVRAIGARINWDNESDEDTFVGIDRNSLLDGLDTRRLRELMEENEQEVECQCCFRLIPKIDCILIKDVGYCCPECNQERMSHQGTNLDLIDADPYDISWDDPRITKLDDEEVEVLDEPTVREGEKADIDTKPNVDEGFDGVMAHDDENMVQCSYCGRLIHIEDSKEVSDGIFRCKDCDETGSKLHADNQVKKCIKNGVSAHCDDYELKEDVDPNLNPLTGIKKELIITSDSGNDYYIGYENERLFAGSITNWGIIREVEIDYDFDESVDANLENLREAIEEYERDNFDDLTFVDRDY